MCDIQGGDNGLIARSATYLFEAMRARGQNVSSGQKPFTMRASYFEIYTEQVINNTDMLCFTLANLLYVYMNDVRIERILLHGIVKGR